jgi:hypothetical protein
MPAQSCRWVPLKCPSATIPFSECVNDGVPAAKSGNPVITPLRKSIGHGLRPVENGTERHDLVLRVMERCNDAGNVVPILSIDVVSNYGLTCARDFGGSELHHYVSM